MTPLYLCASSTSTATDASTSTMSSAPVSDSNTRRPSNVIMHPPTQPPKPKKKKTHSTDPFLRDFTLVAEAARRAQMSLMTRDMENVLSATNKRNARFDWGCCVPNQFDYLAMRGGRIASTCPVMALPSPAIPSSQLYLFIQPLLYERHKVTVVITSLIISDYWHCGLFRRRLDDALHITFLREGQKTRLSRPIHDVIMVDDLPIFAESSTFSSEYWREQCLKLLGMHTAVGDVDLELRH
ncbi:hypothetical protein F5Y03DRAFT_395889 [Xylaria venustula]|nr:hypothetical protein F5Y03DRAFT_395889 [Xylaria venustula]